jgi:tetratricopeptide (TPR) repeat protein
MSDEKTTEELVPDKAEELMRSDKDQLAELEPKMRMAMTAREQGNNGEARKLFESILQTEPRLAEPRLELAHMAAMAEDWEEAQTQARLAVDILERGGQWTEDIAPKALLGFALNLLGELIVRPLEEGDLFLTDRPQFNARWNEASEIFARCLEADPENVDARRNATRYRALELEN